MIAWASSRENRYCGIGRRSGLPTSVSLIGPPNADWQLLAAGAALQAELGT